MVLRCLRAELMKCRRAPVWLAFLVLPLFPAVLGTFNYLGNLEVLDAGWYSLWTQHTLFASMFFLPAQFGVFCAWQWRLEHADHNWNAALTAPVPVRALYLGKLLLDVGVSALAMALIGLLSLVRMEWDEATRWTAFFWRRPEPLDLALLCLWAALFLTVGRTLFVRKEV